MKNNIKSHKNETDIIENIFNILTFGLVPSPRKVLKSIDSFFKFISSSDNEKKQFGKLISSDMKMISIINELITACKTKSPILLLGETGTGKEILAEGIHFTSERKNKPFIAINIAGYPTELLESELFGHVKGAFTGAYRDRVGIFEKCEGGTVFLDEIGDTPISTQTKLLRTLEEGYFKKLGGTENIKLDVRFISGTNKNIVDLIKSGLLKLDFYYRINSFEIKIPTFEERSRNDKKLIVNSILNELKNEYNSDNVSISKDAMSFIYNYNWPGNIRELKNTLARSFYKTIATSSKIIDEKLLKQSVNLELGEYFKGLAESKEIIDIKKNNIHFNLRSEYSDLFSIDYFTGFKLKELLSTIECEYIKDAFERCKTEKEMGRLLGYSQQSIHNKIKKYLPKDT